MSKMLIRYNRPNVHRVEGVTLTPGINEVDAESFERWSGWKAFKALLEKQPGGGAPVVEVLPKPTAPKKPEGDDDSDETDDVDLSKLSAKDAVAIVEETLNVTLLKKWQATETRASVKKALEEQLVLTGPTAPKKPEGDDDQK